MFLIIEAAVGDGKEFLSYFNRLWSLDFLLFFTTEISLAYKKGNGCLLGILYFDYT